MATSPFEFTAMPDTSPKFMSFGSLKKFGTESNGISGTAAPCCAESESDSAPIAATSVAIPNVVRFIHHPPEFVPDLPAQPFSPQPFSPSPLALQPSALLDRRIDVSRRQHVFGIDADDE